MSEGRKYIRRTLRDYTLTMKLQIVSEIKQGQIPVTAAVRRYGILSRSIVVKWLSKNGNFGKIIPHQICQR